MRLLLNQGDSGGGGGDFIATLPEDVRNEPSLRNFRDVGDLAKGYVNAQKLIGTRRVPAPDANWTDQQWSDFYSQVGRPETADKYTLPQVQLEEGLTVDKDKVLKIQQHLHKLGLSDKQFRGVMEYYFGTLNDAAKAEKNARDASRSQAEQSLKAEWGPKYDAQVELARATLSKFGDEEFVKHMEATGIGNDPRLIKMLQKVGSMMLEDSSRRGGGDPNFLVNDRSKALQEIENKKSDPEFMRAYGDKNHPGHKAAVDIWMRLHTVAYPGKEQI